MFSGRRRSLTDILLRFSNVTEPASLARRNSSVSVDVDGDTRERTIAGTRNMVEAIAGIVNRAMSRADDQFALRIVVHRDPLVPTGALAGNEVAVGETNEQATRPIRRIGENA